MSPRFVRADMAGRTSRLGQFAAPFDLSDEDHRQRPEIEDDDPGDWRN